MREKIVKQMIKKIILFMLITLNLVSYAAIAVDTHMENKVKTTNTNINGVKAKTLAIKINKEISTHNLSLEAGITFSQLNELNDGQFKEDETLKVGRIVMIPQSVKLPENVASIEQDKNQSDSAITLPTLGKSTDSNGASVLNEVINYTPIDKFISGDAEQNVANVLNTVANEDWEQFNVKDIVDNAETQLKNQVKGQITGKITDAAEGFLGRFGKAEINLSVDENGNLEGSSLNMLSPIIDSDNSLFFTQVGVHGQGSGDDARTIGNFGLGYRYEQEEWLAGGNVFIDHDFTGSNTRLGLGGEYWRDNFKLATNVYTPLSSWKESSVMKNYEALIYDERPARGFDVRAQGYLPSYPQLGGSLVYEQYFGDEVALFSTEKRQKDPYALTVGLDYTPVPLITTKVSHKVGKDGQNDTRVDLNLNLQLGTSLEAQLDPANVAVARSLKGSRYDMVDRNYDIVFEYKKEDFSISINGPAEAMLGTDVTVTSDIRSRAEIQSYEWIVTDMRGNIIPKGNNSDKTLKFTVIDYIDHYVRLKVRTVRGYEATSEPLRVHVLAAHSQSTLKANDDSDVNMISFVDDLPPNFFYKDLEDLPTDQKKELLFTAFDADGEPYDLTVNPDIRIDWRITGTSGDTFTEYKGEGPLRFEWIPGDNPNQIKLIVIADKSFTEKNGSKSIDVLVSSELDQTVFAQTEKPIKFVNPDSTLTKLGIDPSNMVIQIWKLADVNSLNTMDDLVSQSGFINAEQISDVKASIEQGQAYRVRIMTSLDGVSNNDPNSWDDVTDRYVDGIVWLYWDPVNGTEVSSDDNPYVLSLNDQTRTYRALEGCRASSTFVTQLNNYDFNELAWGDILLDDNAKPRPKRIITEQGLRLAVQFDFTALNEPKDLSTTLCKDNVPEVDPTYLGYDNGQQRAVAWSEAE